MAGSRLDPVYLDCNATTPVEPEVADVVLHYLTREFGNAGSRTHPYGSRAAAAVRRARELVAKIADAEFDETLFTSGCTESNNIALLGLEPYAVESGKRHIVTTAIEHKAVLEPLGVLQDRGFEVSIISPDQFGVISARAVLDAVRADTLLVSVMHVNNETGAIQPVWEIAEGLKGTETILHTDAAQGFGKEMKQLRHQRIDLISVSGHKIYAPKGIGALIVRNSPRTHVISPITFGGGQERRLRPGTLPVPLIVGLGAAAEIAIRDEKSRWDAWTRFRARALSELAPLKPVVHGSLTNCLPTTLNVRFAGLDSEAVMLALKDLVAVSNGSACTSHAYAPSHVLSAMGLSAADCECAVRWSWSHLTPDPDWASIRRAVTDLL